MVYFHSQEKEGDGVREGGEREQCLSRVEEPWSGLGVLKVTDSFCL